jgi:hypothetical protein
LIGVSRGFTLQIISLLVAFNILQYQAEIAYVLVDNYRGVRLPYYDAATAPQEAIAAAVTDDASNFGSEIRDEDDYLALRATLASRLC